MPTTAIRAILGIDRSEATGSPSELVVESERVAVPAA
jgi:hypothetical protein